ncbi:MAG: hypothetical protein FJ267_06235, partial [Planctomycetes bacterium]|nr:hypothetical protein [Planctomycetota bacterium]
MTNRSREFDRKMDENASKNNSVGQGTPIASVIHLFVETEKMSMVQKRFRSRRARHFVRHSSDDSRTRYEPQREKRDFRMIRQYWFTGFGIFIAMVLTVPCWAWNDAGHMTIARIAWEQLSETQRAKVVSILRHHPHRESILMKYRPESASESEWIFLRAAVWSDHIRPSRDLTHDQIA